MIASQDSLLINILFSTVAALACAGIPFLFGYGYDKRSVGDSRAKFLFVFVLVFGTFMGYMLGAYLGVFAAIVFTIEIVFLGKPEESDVTQ
jgi:hypothetical protein